MAERNSVVLFDFPQHSSSADRVSETMVAEIERNADGVDILTLPPMSFSLGEWRTRGTGKSFCIDIDPNSGKVSVGYGVLMTETLPDGKKKQLTQMDGEPFVTDPLVIISQEKS